MFFLLGSTRRAFSQLKSLKIRGSVNFLLFRKVVRQNLKLKNWERARQKMGSSAQPRGQSLSLFQYVYSIYLYIFIYLSHIPPTSSSPQLSGQPPSILDLSSIHDRHFRLTEQHIKFHPNVVNVPTSPAIIITPPREEKVGTQVLTKKPVLIVKYADDNLSVEKINFGNVQAATINNKLVESKLAIPSQNAFRSITTNAKKKGMLVNADKANMVCISDSLSYTPTTYFYDSNDNKIECGHEMKVLGFWFSSKPTVSLHVDKIVKQLRCRYWSLTHLGKVGFSKEELVAVYKSTILPIADYCAPAYHPMTKDIHNQLLENAQVGALRRIFGYGLSARKLREKAGVSTLRARRIELTDKFATKCAASSISRIGSP